MWRSYLRGLENLGQLLGQAPALSGRGMISPGGWWALPVELLSGPIISRCLDQALPVGLGALVSAGLF